MKKLSFTRLLKGCCIAFLLFFVFLTQMFYSNGLYKSAIWIDEFYQEHMKESAPSITASMTPDVIEANKTRIKKKITDDAIFIEGANLLWGQITVITMRQHCRGALQFQSIPLS